MPTIGKLLQHIFTRIPSYPVLSKGLTRASRDIEEGKLREVSIIKNRPYTVTWLTLHIPLNKNTYLPYY